MRPAVALALAGLTIGCADDLPPIGPAVVTDISVLSGDDQTGFPRYALPDSLRVLVADADGDPVRGAMVRWTVQQSDGQVDPVTSVTNADGVASTSFTLGDGPMPSVVASVEGRSLATTFTAEAHGFVLDCAPAAVTNSRGDIRALGCSAVAVGEFAGVVALSFDAVPGIEVGFASGTLNLGEADGPIGTSALMSIGLGVPTGVHAVVVRAQAGDELASDTVNVTVR